MNQPVPVSRKTGGVMVVGPSPQSSVTSPATSALTSTTAGLARSRASCTTIVRCADAGDGATSRGSATATTSPTAAAKSATAADTVGPIRRTMGVTRVILYQEDQA